MTGNWGMTIRKCLASHPSPSYVGRLQGSSSPLRIMQEDHYEKILVNQNARGEECRT